jgi:hypothetical protein
LIINKEPLENGRRQFPEGRINARHGDSAPKPSECPIRAQEEERNEKSNSQ